MRRTSKGKGKKDATNDTEGDVTESVQADDNETESTPDVEASNSNGKKRNARGNVKTSDDEHENGEEEEAAQENEKPPSKKKKKDSEESLNGDKAESDEESAKSPNKKKEDKTEEVAENGKAASKNKKKGKSSQKKKEEDDAEVEEYEVEKIVEQRTIKGRRQFLVRWVGYSAEDDTWENEKDLNCQRLIEEFLADQEENNDTSVKEDAEEEEKPSKKSKAKKEAKKAKKETNTKSKKGSSGSKSKAKENGDAKNDTKTDEDGDTSTEYEVEKILEVHFKKDKKREFLIRWKGFTSKDDTWEPEENLHCSHLIEKFMEKLDKIKSVDSRELRDQPTHTKRYTLTMHADKRQSRRNANKERVTYHECDE